MHAPVITVRKKRESQPWITSDIHQLMRKRNYYRRKHQKNRDQVDWKCYVHLRNLVIKKLRQAKTAYMTTICKDIAHSPRKAWSQLNRYLGRKVDKSTVSIQENGRLLTSNSTIVNAVSSHFSSITSVISNPRHGPPATFEPAHTTFKFSTIEEEDVTDILRSLKVNKATGADGISARLLKLTAPSISNSLTLLFNHSLQTGSFPDEWKHANVTPVPKSGDKHLVQNYRPISVIPVIAKVFQTLVHKQLYNYLNTNSLLNPVQSGFRPMHCTQDVLLKTVDDWRASLDLGKLVGAVMIDLSKAFDSINHQVLLQKLNKYSVHWGGTPVVYYVPTSTETKSVN